MDLVLVMDALTGEPVFPRNCLSSVEAGALGIITAAP